MFEDFDNAEKSDVIADMPNSTSLFKAFINKQDDEVVREKEYETYQRMIEKTILKSENEEAEDESN